jgi:hypothetical protein
MQLHFDEKSLHLQTICGILEQYAPSEEIVDLVQRLEALKAKLVAFQEKELLPELTKIREQVKEINSRPVKQKSEE